ncbi:hypothetical protein D3C72_1991980 [compost metagenome]
MGMPMPESRTSTRSSLGSELTCTVMVPPSGVNLMAFPTRLIRTCSRRPGSSTMGIGWRGMASTRVMPAFWAWGRMLSMAPVRVSRTSTLRGSSRNEPPSSAEKSKRSSTSRCRRRVPSWI